MKICIITVKALGQLSKDFGAQKLEIQVPQGSNLLDVFHLLASKNNIQLGGSPFFGENQEPTRNLLIFLNDIEIRALQGMQTTILGDSTLFLVPAIHGG